MDALTYLNQIKQIETQIRHKKAEKKRWKELATDVSVSFGERVSSSSSKQRMAVTIEDGIDKEREIDRQIVGLLKLRDEIVDTIEQLPEVESDILYRVYVLGETLKEVAFARGESYSKITRRRRLALKQLQIILNRR